MSDYADVEFSEREIAREIMRRDEARPDRLDHFKTIPAEPRGIDADWPGPFPRQSFAPGEREAFEQIRADLDAPMQVVGVRPSYPQQHLDTQAYEGLLLKAIAHATPGSKLQDTPQVESLARIGYLTSYHHREKIVAEAMASPALAGRLAPIKKIDRTGRKITEFVGSKRAWMAPYTSPAQVNEDGSILSVDGQPRRFLPTVV